MLGVGELGLGQLSSFHLHCKVYQIWGFNLTLQITSSFDPHKKKFFLDLDFQLSSLTLPQQGSLMKTGCYWRFCFLYKSRLAH